MTPKELAVHVVPFKLYAATCPLVLDTATKRPLPQVTEFQLELDDNVLAVQVNPPSAELAATVPPLATATHNPIPYAMLFQLAVAIDPPLLQVTPPSTENTLNDALVSDTATQRPPAYATLDHADEALTAPPDVQVTPPSLE